VDAALVIGSVLLAGSFAHAQSLGADVSDISSALGHSSIIEI
jgi:hypothetical protein